MNVLADGRWAGDTGIGRLYKEIIDRKPTSVQMQTLNLDLKLGHLLSPWYLGKKINESNAEIFYSPSFMPPWQSKIPFVITIHDLNHLYYYTLFHKIYLKHLIANLAGKSKKIITVSNYTKNEMVEVLKIDPNKIEVIYNGIDSSFASNKEIYSLNRPYFLYVGNRRKYKNILRMLQGFSKAKISKEYLFVLSGDIDDQLKKVIESLGLQNRVKFLGFIKEEQLPSIYKGAYALLFVSLMEGFGLPVIESMASGTPVITSNITSMPEIAGADALLVNPIEIDSIANAIEQLVNDKKLHHELSKTGRKRAQQFNWNITAKKTWDTIMY
ncbi:glycosyltransferase family 4 protein [Mucilaginibacter flavus]|uniref:glycosyltransferase family 4 protein n=1 Tax=Mucilaginibacter flavus TaxID=931504 RepID=UPI0025B2CB3E|nr:glycosyltransferase family 1 protein [Mucilaginibacter flavus]MDN3582815.1 glycosyltransferase family 1 protein [Mucilaginibacter flavus]